MIIDVHMHVGAWNHADSLERACAVDDDSFAPVRRTLGHYALEALSAPLSGAAP